MNYDKHQPLISVHVPKCAGTSFSSILESWFGKNLMFHYYDEARGTPPKKHQIPTPLPGPLCIHGHFNHKRGTGFEDYYPELNQRIAVVRDPWDLHLSNYFYGKRQKARKARDHARGGKRRTDWPADLPTYLRRREKSMLPNFFPTSLTVENVDDVLSKEFIHIGIFEDLGGSVSKLAEALGMQDFDVPRLNESKRDEDTDSAEVRELRALFEEKNALAYKIYEFAQRLNK